MKKKDLHEGMVIQSKTLGTRYVVEDSKKVFLHNMEDGSHGYLPENLLDDWEIVNDSSISNDMDDNETDSCQSNDCLESMFDMFVDDKSSLSIKVDELRQSNRDKALKKRNELMERLSFLEKRKIAKLRYPDEHSEGVFLIDFGLEVWEVSFYGYCDVVCVNNIKESVFLWSVDCDQLKVIKRVNNHESEFDLTEKQLVEHISNYYFEYILKK